MSAPSAYQRQAFPVVDNVLQIGAGFIGIIVVEVPRSGVCVLIHKERNFQLLQPFQIVPTSRHCSANFKLVHEASFEVISSLCCGCQVRFAAAGGWHTIELLPFANLL